MSFNDVLSKIDIDFVNDKLNSITSNDIEEIINRNSFSFSDFLYLASKPAENFLEEMAKKARRLTLQHFGRTISLYIPLYLSNYCLNSCIYCGFRHDNDIPRKTLGLPEIEREMQLIAEKGFTQILLLTGEHPHEAPLSYLVEAVKLARKYFALVTIEIYPLDYQGYRALHEAGVDGITLYQETYDRKVYSEMHGTGPKSDYLFRLDAIERSAKVGIRNIGIGILLGLTDFRLDAYLLACHAVYLLKHYWQSFLSISFPRLKEIPGGLNVPHVVTDRNLTQLILAFRLVFPEIGLVISTRESAEMRDNLLPLGITRISAGSHTEPGGYSAPDIKSAQFYVEDRRSPMEVVSKIKSMGYDPVWLDWSSEFSSKDRQD